MYDFMYETNNAPLCGIRLDDLCKHMFVTAMSGSYKTTLMIAIEICLCKNDINFMIMEPAKTEYRGSKAMTCQDDPEIAKIAKKIKLLTPGNDKISPICLDSLWLASSMSQSQKIDNQKGVICASGDYFDPLPQLIYEALTLVFYNYNYKYGPKPHIKHIYQQCLKLLESRYGPEARDNLIGALKSRMDSLSNGYSSIGRIFSCGENIPSIQSLVNSCSIMELAALGDNEMPFYALNIMQLVREELSSTKWLDRTKPRFVFILEESHRFFPGISGGETAMKVKEYIDNMLVELRALGVAVILVDQSPSAMPPEVIRATATKCVGREVEASDRQIMTDCMMLTPEQQDRLALLRPGEFYLFSELYPRAVKIRVPCIYKKISIPFADELLDDEILNYISKEKWFKDLRTERIKAELKLLATELMNLHENEKNLEAEMKKFILAISGLDKNVCRKIAANLINKTQNILTDFHKNYLIPLAGIDNGTIYSSPHKAFRNSLISQYELIEQRLDNCCRKLEKYSKG